mgnify:CR=1 FL=1|tara:strand:+ start:802 stop:987 length:186 start_codon:yes stop_codon:yes gene_type:complete
MESKYTEGQIVLVNMGSEQFACTISEVTWSEDRGQYEYHSAQEGVWFSDDSVVKVLDTEFE